MHAAPFYESRGPLNRKPLALTVRLVVPGQPLSPGFGVEAKVRENDVSADPAMNQSLWFTSPPNVPSRFQTLGHAH